MSEDRARWVALAVLGVLALLLGTGLVLSSRALPSASPDRGVGAPAGAPHDVGGALDLLHRWDRARATAWARGDVRGLRGLYVDNAPAGDADVAMLRRYVARGLVVRDLRTQVLRARLRGMDGDVVRLEVTERMVGGVAATADGSRALPRSVADTRVVELREVRRRWRVAAVLPG